MTDQSNRGRNRPSRANPQGNRMLRLTDPLLSPGSGHPVTSMIQPVPTERKMAMKNSVISNPSR